MIEVRNLKFQKACEENGTPKGMLKSSSRLSSFSCLGLLISLCLMACSTTPQHVSREALHDTKVWILERHPAIEHPITRTLFSRLIERLETIDSLATQDPKATPKHAVVYLIASNDPALFSLCDGSIFLTKKTFQNVSNAQQLIALLAHEIAHIQAEDACTHSEEKGIQLEKELKADKKAVRMLTLAMVDPRSLISAIQRTIPRSLDPSSELNPHMSKAFSARIEALEEETQGIPPFLTKVPEERLFRKAQAFLQGL